MRALIIAIVTMLALTCACLSKNKKKAVYNPIQTVRADPAEADCFIKRFKGALHLSDTLSVNVILTNWCKNRLSGVLMYEGKTDEFRLEGYFLSVDSFVMYEEGFNGEHRSTFNGVLEHSTSINGIWYNVDSSTTSSFSMQAISEPKDPHGWTGAWHLNDPWDTSTLIIGNVSPTHIQFAMQIYINDHREQFEGIAKIDGTYAKYYEMLLPYLREKCKLTFHRKDRQVVIEEHGFPPFCDLGITCWMGRTYDDIYFGRKARLDFIGKDSVFADTAGYLAFQKLVGDKMLNQFAYNMERLERVEYTPRFNDFSGHAWKGRVRGFHRMKEGIIAFDTMNHIYAATSDPPLGFLDTIVVHYYSTDLAFQKSMPPPVEKWVEEFIRFKVVYH